MSDEVRKRKSCCAPLTDSSPGVSENSEPKGNLHLSRALEVGQAEPETLEKLRRALVRVPKGIFEMGARHSRVAADLDSPRRKVAVSEFLMAPTAVSNKEFSAFIAATGYETVAEAEGWSFVFHLLLPDRGIGRDSPPGLPWWRQVPGASWCQPEGIGSDLFGRESHPVVHISWFDALAYVTWAGLRLPYEAEWERAARGGLARRKFPWGNTILRGRNFAMNTFQGIFPNSDTGEDGWAGTAPVDAYAPNGYGMYNMTGNVWEWVADYFGPLPEMRIPPVRDPRGPETGYQRVQRGGSFLCHESYCDRYQVHSRTSNDPDSSTSNSGFRVCVDI